MKWKRSVSVLTDFSVNFTFNKEVPEPKPQFWAGDSYLELYQALSKVASEHGWELVWRSSEFKELTRTH